MLSRWVGAHSVGVARFLFVGFTMTDECVPAVVSRSAVLFFLFVGAAAQVPAGLTGHDPTPPYGRNIWYRTAARAAYTTYGVRTDSVPPDSLSGVILVLLSSLYIAVDLVYAAPLPPRCWRGLVAVTRTESSVRDSRPAGHLARVHVRCCQPSRYWTPHSASLRAVRTVAAYVGVRVTYHRREGKVFFSLLESCPPVVGRAGGSRTALGLRSRAAPKAWITRGGPGLPALTLTDQVV